MSQLEERDVVDGIGNEEDTHALRQRRDQSPVGKAVVDGAGAGNAHGDEELDQPSMSRSGDEAGGSAHPPS
jgi:hypothetical protein